jgi:biotin carboxyl carrier protein
MILSVKLDYQYQGERLSLTVEPAGEQWRITLPDGSIHTVAGEWEDEHTLLLRWENRQMRVPLLYSKGEKREIAYNGQVYRFERETTRKPRAAHHSVSEGVLTAPMPGLIIKVLAEVGEKVRAGQRLIVLEAMKMEQALMAPYEGIVQHLHVQEGEVVAEGTVLMEIEKDSNLS